MKIEKYQEPKSSFLSLEKDLGIITNQMLQNRNLKKLLYYTMPDALDQPALTQEQSVDLFRKNIKIVPKLYVDGSVLNYIIISIDNFTENANNPEFRDNIITFDIICHFDQWQLRDFQLRPYKIAGEIDSMFNNKKLTGIGELHFLGANQIVLNSEFAGLTVMYQAIHGGEDKYTTANPMDQKDMVDNFNDVEQLSKWVSGWKTSH